jgi:hypothetical protein
MFQAMTADTASSSIVVSMLSKPTHEVRVFRRRTSELCYQELRSPRNMRFVRERPVVSGGMAALIASDGDLELPYVFDLKTGEGKLAPRPKLALDYLRPSLTQVVSFADTSERLNVVLSLQQWPAMQEEHRRVLAKLPPLHSRYSVLYFLVEYALSDGAIRPISLLPLVYG